MPAPTDPPAPPAGGAQPPATPPVPPEVPPVPPAATEPPTPPPPPPPPPEEITFTSDALATRLERARVNARAKLLADHGFADEEAFAAAKKAADEQTAADEEKRREEMSEIERYKTDLAAQQKKTEDAEAGRATAEREAEEARVELHLRQLCAAKGIANAEYAIHLLNRKLAELPDGDNLDEGKFFDNLLTDDTQKAALGVMPPPPLEGEANTATPRTAPNPPPAGDDPPKSAMHMTPAEVAAAMAKEGFHA